MMKVKMNEEATMENAESYKIWEPKDKNERHITLSFNTHTYTQYFATLTEESSLDLRFL